MSAGYGTPEFKAIVILPLRPDPITYSSTICQTLGARLGNETGEQDREHAFLRSAHLHMPVPILGTKYASRSGATGQPGTLGAGCCYRGRHGLRRRDIEHGLWRHARIASGELSFCAAGEQPRGFLSAAEGIGGRA